MKLELFETLYTRHIYRACTIVHDLPCMINWRWKFNVHLPNGKVLVDPSEGEQHVRAETGNVIFGDVFALSGSILGPVGEVAGAKMFPWLMNVNYNNSFTNSATDYDATYVLISRRSTFFVDRPLCANLVVHDIGFVVLKIYWICKTPQKLKYNPFGRTRRMKIHNKDCQLDVVPKRRHIGSRGQHHYKLHVPQEGGCN